MNTILLYFSLKYKGDWDKIYKALEKKEKISISEIQQLDKRIKKDKIQFFTILDESYPESFKGVYKPPFVIFYKGNKSLISNKDIYFLTGDTNKNEHVKRNIQLLLPNILKKYKTLNSLHKGVEELVYEKSMKENNTIFVCANNINSPESTININGIDLSKNLIISEYYDNAHVTKNTLRARNRLLVAIAKAIILVSSNSKSWTNNLVTQALNAGKDIYCLPDDPNNLSGNTELIKQGANLVTHFKDLI